ncbi:MAG TPA: GNAT family N-acetyltransferase [Gammaproteobacteria bacterium]|nr:GNAT family N-acetyltransferase [Gammaproteobacteria bacterium]
MQVRQATLKDIPDLLWIRKEATDNALRTSLNRKMLERSLKNHCRGWVVEFGGMLVGFSLANKKNHTIWGLFVLDAFQGRGFGELLLKEAEKWLFSEPCGFLGLKTCNVISLKTKKGCPAEEFYRYMGWHRGEEDPEGEITYWLSREDFFPHTS